VRCDHDKVVQVVKVFGKCVLQKVGVIKADYDGIKDHVSFSLSVKVIVSHEARRAVATSDTGPPIS